MTTPGMTNAELESAIAQAFLMVGATSKTEERHYTAMNHLRELLKVQQKRAALMEHAA